MKVSLGQILTWNTNPPDMPGYWLSGYWDHGRFFVKHWTIAETLHLPKNRKPDWLWFGPILPPEK